MVDDNYGFCPHCGQNMKSDATFCPSCGTVLSQSIASPEVHDCRKSKKKPMRGVFLVVFILLTVYTVVELLSSITLLTFNEATYDMIDKMTIETFGMNFADYMRENANLVFTKEEFLSNVSMLGIFGLISSILSGISAFLCFKREKHLFAVIFCVLSAVMVMIGSVLAPQFAGVASAVIDMVIGLIVAFMIYSSKKYFIS